MLLLRLLLLLRAAWLLLFLSAIAPAATATLAAAFLFTAGGRLLRLLLRARLLALLAALGVGLLPAFRALPFALIRTPVALAGPRTLAFPALVALLFRRSGPLLPVAHFLLHEAALLCLGARTRLVVSAIRTTSPAFGIRLLAVRADNALRERHVEIGAHCTLRAVADEARRKTLQTLITLAESSNPADCWDDSRAEDLLRSQSSAEEVRALGMSEQMIERVFGNAGRIAAATQKHRYVVRVEARFEAAHYLREYRGISEPLHGHSYKVEAELAAAGGGVDADAIAVDFVSAKRKLETLAKKLDYGCINDVAPFDRLNPSAENIAQWFANELGASVAGENARVVAVTIWEGPVNSVRYEQAP
ncbi:MAG TPA: 6-carboxytetrahydropterin synthase [Thermoanaerobaculia bacterium]|jgi:6-pyruvoyltetrahydropterin/6-carboxytetrahydropterin synthase